MNAAQIADAIRRSLKERGLSPFRAAVDAGLPENALRTVLAGHEPKLGRLVEICDALGLEVYVGPQRTAHGLDADRLQLALETVEEGLAATGRVMSARQKARIVLATYDFFDGGSDAETRAQVIQLIQATG